MGIYNDWTAPPFWQCWLMTPSVVWHSGQNLYHFLDLPSIWYPHTLCSRIGISILKIAEKGVLMIKFACPRFFRGFLLAKYSRKLEKGVCFEA